MNYLSTFLLFCAVIGSTAAASFNQTYSEFERKAIKTTYFTFTAEITCPIAKSWCVQLSYFEHDRGTPNDRLGVSGWQCSEEPTMTIETFGKDNGDGPFDHWYEPFVTVTHNCRADESVGILQHFLQKVQTDLTYAQVDYSLTLY